MPKVEGPDGQICDDTDNPTALAYYRREQGYTVLGEEPPVVVEGGVEFVAAPPAKSASKADWFEYAKGLGLDIPDDEADITKDELIGLVEKAS